MTPCMVCGNEIAAECSRCPYCGSDQQTPVAVAAPRSFLHKTVNLEYGRPIVATALARLSRELAAATSAGVQVLTIIHGYGSSGKGGVIREECRRTLDYLASSGRIAGLIPGEEFHRKAGPTKALLRRYPNLAADGNLGRNNPGITIVIM
jgi:hypothetical protein